MRGTTVLIATLCLAAPVSALESTTGIYEGPLKCTGLASGAPSKLKRDFAVVIRVDGSGNVVMQVNANPSFLSDVLGGFVAEDSAKADRGTITATACSLNYSTRNGQTVYLDVVVKPGGAKASVKGTLIDLSVGDGEARICTFTAKRTSTDPPVFKACII